MQETRSGFVCLIGRATLLLAAVLLLPGVARAAAVTVDCDGGPADFPSITDALNALDVVGPHTITVTGTCAERVFILERDRVTIEAPVGDTATVVNPGPPPRNLIFVLRSRSINLRRLVIREGRFGVLILQNSEVALEGCTIRDNTRSGIFARRSVLSIDGSTTIENNGGQGISLRGTQLRVSGGFGGPGTENIIRLNGLDGLSLANGASATLSGDNRIQNNGGFGISVFHTSNATLIDALVEENGQTGVIVAETSHAELLRNQIRNNGSAGPDRGGLRISENSDVFVDGGNEISNNAGPGILVDVNATLSSLGDNTISNNSEQGVHLRRQSLAHFFGADTIFGNGVANLACDTTSLTAGDLTGIMNIQCAKIERELGPPRPGHILPELPPQP